MALPTHISNSQICVYEFVRHRIFVLIFQIVHGTEQSFGVAIGVRNGKRHFYQFSNFTILVLTLRIFYKRQVEPKLIRFHHSRLFNILFSSFFPPASLIFGVQGISMFIFHVKNVVPKIVCFDEHYGSWVYNFIL